MVHPHVILAKARIQRGRERHENPPSLRVRGQGDAHTSFSRRRESRVDGRGTNPPFAFTPCHSEHSEESLTSFPRRRESRGDGTGKSWQSLPHHGNHGSPPPPSFSRRRESRGDGMGKIMAILPHHGNHGSKPPGHSRAGGNPKKCTGGATSRQPRFEILAIFPHKHQYVCIIKSEDFRQSRADECGHLSSRWAKGNKR